MSASLVGSEMCIRDRWYITDCGSENLDSDQPHAEGSKASTERRAVPVPVSYTHLTLPTICSV
eukprot:12349615-Alexandrium_andersonii.AAC.1